MQYKVNFFLTEGLPYILALLTSLRIHQLHLPQRSETTSLRSSLGMTLKCIQQWGKLKEKTLEDEICETKIALVGAISAKNALQNHKRHNSNKLVSKVVKLVTVVEGNPKAPFSIATTPRYRRVRYSFPWIAPLYPWYVLCNAEC